MGKFKIDVVLECTGLFRSHADATRHLEAGLKGSLLALRLLIMLMLQLFMVLTMLM